MSKKATSTLTIHNRIDPGHCGCTDCLTGWSVPLERANWLEIKRMLKGKVMDATSHVFEVKKTRVTSASGERVEVTSIYNSNMTWTWYTND